MTWSEFKTEVNNRLPVDAARLGSEAANAGWMKDAVRDLQSHIPQYREGHVSYYSAANLTPQGGSMLGTAPEGARITEINYTTSGQHCFRRPAYQHPWSRRNELVCDCVITHCCRALVAINPSGTDFVIFPALTDGEQIELQWDGTKTDFEDADEVPFGEEAALGVSFYMMYLIESRVKKDYAAAEFYMSGPGAPGSRPGNYVYERRKLAVDMGEKTHLPKPALKPSHSMGRSTWCGTCVGADGETVVEAVLFGDSGEASTIANTETVATMAKAIGPNLIVHLGDTNYPGGSLSTIWDNFQKWYQPYLESGKWLQAWGNHDLESALDGVDGGPLLSVLPWIEDLNGGKLYYRYKKGPIEFFVLNSDISDANETEADGIIVGSDQQLWLAAALADSTADWKVIAFHRAPISSDEDHAPGSLAMRWDFGFADLIVCAHGHNYERLLYGTTPQINVGTGGATLREFEDTPEVPSLVRISELGVLRLRASANELRFVFQNTAGQFLDSMTLTK